ncbi:MAG: GNAT family N-acetyltransferase [Actinomycetota bacterium]
MLIRNAERGDAADLVRLRAIMLEQVIGGPVPGEDMEVIEKFFADWDYDDPLCLVAEEEGAVLGCIAASFYRLFPGTRNPSGLLAVVHNFAVYEEYRGGGVGKSLFSHVLRECRERGVGRVSLNATAMGRPLYESFGFSTEVISCPEMRLYHKALIELDLG